MIRECALSIALAVTAFTGAAQARKLDRRQAITSALAQNPQIAAARAEEAVLSAQAAQVNAARTPAIGLTLGVGPSDVATLVPGSADQSVERQYKDLRWSDLSAVFVTELTVVQPLYTFGKIALRGEAAQAGLQARRAETRMRRADVAFAVAQIYEGLLFARDAERFFDEIARWLNATLEETEDKLANGMGNVTERDVLRLQAAQGLSAMGLHRARAGQAQARAGLSAYLGMAPGESIDLAEDELAAVGAIPEDPAELARLARDNRPELVALREGRKALAALGRAERAGYWPDLFAAGFLSMAYTPGRDWIQNRYVVDPLNHVVPGALLGLRWQLQGGMAGARAAEQQAHAEALGHLRGWADAGVPAEARKAWEDVHRCDNDIERGESAVKKAKRWMVEASADYDVGLLDVREVSDAVDAYVTLRLAVLRARYERNVAMADLSRATGTLDGDADIFYLAGGSQAGAP